MDTRRTGYGSLRVISDYPWMYQKIEKGQKMPNFYKILGIWGIIDPPVCLQLMKNPDGKI